MHKGKHVHPFIALGHRGVDRRSLWGPDSSQDRLETNAVLIHGPEFDAGLGMLVLHQGHVLGKFF